MEPTSPNLTDVLAPIERRVEAMSTFAGLADLCGHADRPGNASGYCAECWAVFRENQGLEDEADSVPWDHVQDALAKVWEHPEKRSRILTRRLKAVKANMVMNLPIYAKLHLRATREAAAKGDARPAEWALGYVSSEGERTVDVAKSAGSADGGVKVFIGVQVGGLPPSQTAVTIDALPPVTEHSGE